MRRRQSEDDHPLRDVPEHLREFPVSWLDVAASGPDGYDEALRAAESWVAERLAWRDEHGYRGDPVTWLRTCIAPRRDVRHASEVWRPEQDRWMTRARNSRRGYDPTVALTFPSLRGAPSTDLERRPPSESLTEGTT